jgi:hypothetical protein
MSYNPAYAFMEEDSSFRFIKDFYKMYAHEMSQGAIGLSQTIVNLAAIRNLTLEVLLKNMVDLAENNGVDEFLVIGHGLHTQAKDPADEQALGFTMKVDDKSGLKTDIDVIYMLAQCLKDGGDSDTLTNMNGSKKFAKGKVATIMGYIRKLQTLRIRRVELRSCTLGQNPALLEKVGILFGARHCVAPKVHCAYGKLHPILKAKDADFDSAVSRTGKIREFTDRVSGERVALQLLKNGSSVFYTTSKDFKWFVDQYIYPSNTYVGGNLMAPVFVAGMITDGFTSEPFALPQEKEYGDMLVWNMNMNIDVGPVTKKAG